MMRGYWNYPGYDMMGGSWIGPLLMIVVWALVIAGVVALIVWAVRGSKTTPTHMAPPAGPSYTPKSDDDAILIARRRLASGDITKEQYDQIMTALHG